MTPYTDSQMVIASQIAYLDFDTAMIAGGPRSVREILELQEQYSTGYEQQYARYLLHRIDTEPEAAVCGDWKIVDVRNDQQGSGMYACVLETGEEDALLAFRGSESDTTENVIKDWGASDLGLLNSIQTPQQIAAEAYTEEVYRDYGEQYSRFGITGHSLGGNLAEHAAVTAPAGMRDRILQCVNLDGPGFSEAYMTAHAAEIRESAPVITHVQWSLVGTLLFPLAGTDYRTVKAVTPEKESKLDALLWRHDTTMVELDERGSFVAGEADPLAAAAGPFSRFADRSQFLLVPGSMALSGAWGILDARKNEEEKQASRTERKAVCGWENRDPEYIYTERGTCRAQYELHEAEAGRLFETIELTGNRLRTRAGSCRSAVGGISCLSANGFVIRQKMAAAAEHIMEDCSDVLRYASEGRQTVVCLRAAERAVQAIWRELG